MKKKPNPIIITPIAILNKEECSYPDFFHQIQKEPIAVAKIKIKTERFLTFLQFGPDKALILLVYTAFGLISNAREPAGASWAGTRATAGAREGPKVAGAGLDARRDPAEHQLVLLQ